MTAQHGDPALRARAIGAVEAQYGEMRRTLTVLGAVMVVLLLVVHVVVTGAFLAGSATLADFAGLNGICAPLTLGAIALVVWSRRRREEPLLEALRSDPPAVRGASFLEFHGRGGVTPGVELRTWDERLWKLRMDEPLARAVVAWLEASRPPEGGYRQGVDQGPRGLLAWSQVARLPAICAHCAAPSEKTTTAVLGLEGGSQLRLSLPICGPCWRRKVRRIVVAVVTMTLAAVGSANLASSLYPPGNMRGLIIFGVVSAVGLVLWLAYRLWPMPPPIAEHRGGAAGAELYLRFESSAFEERVRADNGL